jgi:hypothetical protein
MARWVPRNRYRMVQIKSGGVVVVFQSYPGMNPLDSCRQACCELEIELDTGCYRLDSLKQNTETKDFRWTRVYRFSLERHG